MTKSRSGVAKYYSRLGSWAGYNLVMGRSQHAGYWDNDTKNEKQAQQNYLRKLAEILKLKKGDKVLDAGSGQGYAARYLAEKTGANVTGITITPREIKISEKLSQKMKNPPQFVLGDFSETVFSDNYFDVIYTNETLAHAENMTKTLQEFYRILKPGGRLILFDYEIDATNPTTQHRELYEFLFKYAGGYGVYQMNPGEISSKLRKSRFEDVHETDWSKFTNNHTTG